MGYDYPYGTSQMLNWMKQNFHNKMNKYLGNQPYVSKRSRMDKLELKKKLRFSPKSNPVTAIFTSLNAKIETSMKAYAFSCLRYWYVLFF